MSGTNIIEHSTRQVKVTPKDGVLSKPYTRDYTYTLDGNIHTITTTNTETGLQTLRTLTWLNGSIVNDTLVEI